MKVKRIAAWVILVVAGAVVLYLVGALVFVVLSDAAILGFVVSVVAVLGLFWGAAWAFEVLSARS